MKLYFTKAILVVFVILCGLELSAQSNWEIGGRFGDDFSIDITIPLAKAPRLHPAMYFHNNVSFGAYFDWMFSLQGSPSGFKFYPGVGPELHFYNGVDFAVAGDFGMEYSFDFPLTIGFDWRPNVMFTDNMKFRAGNWGILARFRFGEGVKFVKSN